MTSQDLSEVEYPRRKTLPVIQPEKKERIERSNTIDTGRNLRRIPSPLPDLPEEEGRKAGTLTPHDVLSHVRHMLIQ